MSNIGFHANGTDDTLSVVASKSSFGPGARSKAASRTGLSPSSVSRNASISHVLGAGALTQSQMALSLADQSFAASLSHIPSSSRNNSLPKLQLGASQQPQLSSSNPKDQHPPLLQLQMASSSTISLPFSGNTASFPPSEATHAVIQSTWSLFSAMSDVQRNQLLKGLLSKCSTKQVDLICTSLNLKMSEPTLPGLTPTVFATDAVGKFAPPRVATSRKSIQNRSPSRLGHKSKSSFTADTINALQEQSEENGTDNSPFRELFISAKPTDNKPDVSTPTIVSDSHQQNSVTTQAHNAYMTPNVYIKLLNTNYNAKTLLKQIHTTSSLETTRTLFEFVLTRTEKQQALLSCMQALAKEPVYGTPESLNALPPSERLLRCALEVCGAKDGTLYRVDEATGDMSVMASTWALREEVLDVMGHGLGERILGSAHLLKGETVNVYNVKESDIYTDEAHEFYNQKGKLEVECVLSLPVVVGGVKLVGAIEVINKKGSELGGKERVSPYFHAEDEHMLKCLGSIWTILLSGSGMGGSAGGKDGEKGKKKDDIKMLMNTASFMSSDLDLNGLVRVVMHTAQELLNAERCALFIVDHKRKELWSSVAEGASEIRIPMTKGIAGYVAMSGETLNIPNAYQDPRFNRAIDIKTGFYTRNILCIPMKSSRGQIIGVAQLINKMPEPMIFTNEDELLLQAFGSLAATTIEKNMVFQELQAILEETNHQKMLLAKTVHGLPHVLLTLDAMGKMLSINHPDLLDLLPEDIEVMTHNSFDIWLNAQQNPLLIEDLRKTYKGATDIVGRDYELVLNGQVYIVNYTASEMAAPAKVASDDDDVEVRATEKPTPAAPRFLKKDSNSDFLAEEDEEEEEEEAEERDEEDVGSERGAAAAATGKKDVDDVLAKKDRKKVENVVLCLEIVNAQRRITDAVLRYMGPQTVAAIADDINDHADGAKLRVSALSIDLRNFATIRDKVTSKDAFHILQLFYNAVYNTMTDFGALVDKVVDEKASIVFGVPVPTEPDAFNAVSACMKLISETEQLVNSELRELQLPVIQIGMGISTGDVLCGILGPPKRLDYVVLGDAVSVAARIQEATKLYGCKLLICDKTQREVRDRFHFREIDHVKVKGSDIPITLFEVLGLSNAELAREVITSTICFELGLSEYRNQNYSVAQLHFKKAIQTSDDGPSRMFVKRCQDLLDGKYKVANDWDGCWKLEFEQE